LRLQETVGRYSIEQCPICGAQWAFPREPDARYYESLYSGKDVCNDPVASDYWRMLFVHSKLLHSQDIDPHWEWLFLRKAQQVALELLQTWFPPGSVILDIGCGTGLFLSALERRAFRPLGLDIAFGPLEMLRKKGYLVSSASVKNYPERWPEPQAITMFEVLEHVPEPVKLLEELHGRFPYSLLVLSVPSPLRWMPLGQRDKGDYPPHHLTRWTEKALRIAVIRSGYTQVEVIFPTPAAGEISGTGLGTLLRSHVTKLCEKMRISHPRRKAQTGNGHIVGGYKRLQPPLELEITLLAVKNIIFRPLATLLRFRGYSAYSMLAVAWTAET